MFDAIILMGGFGTRLATVSKGVPKAMMPIGDMPFVYLLLKKLEEAGCKKIILSLHYKADEIIKRIQLDNPVKCELIFAVESKPLGTGGAIKYASKFSCDEKILVMNGDTYSSLNIQNFVQKSTNPKLSIAGIHIANASRYGGLAFNSDYILTSMDEKKIKGSSVINSGTYYISKSILKQVHEEVFSFENKLVPRYVGLASVIVFDGFFIDIGIPEDYELATSILK